MLTYFKIFSWNLLKFNFKTSKYAQIYSIQTACILGSQGKSSFQREGHLLSTEGSKGLLCLEQSVTGVAKEKKIKV